MCKLPDNTINNNESATHSRTGALAGHFHKSICSSPAEVTQSEYKELSEEMGDKDELDHIPPFW